MPKTLLSRFFYKVIARPAPRRVAWKLLYEFLARRFRFPDWHFMNYGFEPSDNVAPLPLAEEDEVHRYSIQLYHELASKAPVADKDVLEVGSGRGGGARYLMRYLKPRRVVGVDLAASAVRFANRQHRVKGLSYVQGDAENLPFDNSSFDVVINVESCHAYGSVPRFLAEVRRVLRPGGHFLCADIRGTERIHSLIEELRASEMEVLEAVDITRNVVTALDLDEATKRRRMRGRFPLWFRWTFEQFAGLRGSPSHRGLTSGGLVYYVFVLRKAWPDATAG